MTDGLEGVAMTKQCCKCGRVEDNGVWKSSRLAPLDGWRVTHGYCPECFDQALAEIETIVRAKAKGVRDGCRLPTTPARHHPCV